MLHRSSLFPSSHCRHPSLSFFPAPLPSCPPQGRSDDAVRNRWSRLRLCDNAPQPPIGFGSVGRNSAPETATGVTGDGGGRAEAPAARRRSSTPAAAIEEYFGPKPERVGWTQVRP